MRISDWSSDVCSSDLSYLGQLLEFPIVSPDSSDAARAAQHSANPLHADDDEPVRIHAGRDIGTTARGLTLWLPKQARIGAGRDIINMIYVGQNLNAGDVTRITAGDRKNTRLKYSH